MVKDDDIKIYGEERFNKDAVSIIIPVYNVENFLEKCLQSIANQTFSNLNIILVNDGSKDGSLEICQRWLKNEKRIILLDKTNGGLSSALNVGIDFVVKNAGEWLCLVDSDDYVSSHYVEYLYKACIENKCKMSACDLQTCEVGKQAELNDKKYVLGNVFTKEESIKNKILVPILRSKMFHVSLFDNLRFPIGKINEDNFLCYKLYYECDKLAVLNNTLYAYNIVSTSIMRKKMSNARLDILDACMENYRFAKSKGESADWFANQIASETFEHIVNLISAKKVKFVNYKQFKKEMKKKFSVIKKETFSERRLGFVRRVVVSLSSRLTVIPLVLYGKMVYLRDN